MKVKVINKNLDDLQDKVFRPVGSVFECNEERAEYLLKNNAVEIVEEEKIEVEPEIIIDEENIVKKVYEENKPTKKKKSSKK